jgi:hypothetical protein
LGSSGEGAVSPPPSTPQGGGESIALRLGHESSLWLLRAEKVVGEARWTAPGMRRLRGAKRRGSTAPRDRWSPAPSREIFHSRRRLGRRRAGSCVRHEAPVHPPAFSCSAGLSFFTLTRFGRSRSITSLFALVEHWPTALQRSDAMSVRARRRCRISFHAIVRRRDFSATWIEDAPRLLFADSRHSRSSLSGSRARGVDLARSRSLGMQGPGKQGAR